MDCDCDCDSTFCIEVDEDEDDDDEDIQSDGFKISNHGPARERWIKNKNNYVLVLRDGDQLCYELRTKAQLSSSDCAFRIQTYKRTNHAKKGIVVILYATKDDKCKVVCCDAQGEVKVESRDSLPNEIGDDGGTFFFFLRKKGICNTYNLIPFSCCSRVLGFDHHANDSQIKLVTHAQSDEVDECTLMCV